MGSIKYSKQPTSCYCLKIRRATNDVTRFYDHVLKPSGITVSQYSILLNISRAEKGSIKELADMAELDRSTLARNIKPLINRNLIIDAKLPGTRDSKLKLTDEGIRTLEKSKMLWEEAQHQVEKKLGLNEIEELEQLLKALEAL